MRELNEYDLLRDPISLPTQGSVLAEDQVPAERHPRLDTACRQGVASTLLEIREMAAAESIVR